MLIKSNSGFTLLELIVVFGIIIMGMLGVSSLVIMNIQAGNVAKNYLAASMLAQEGLELVRNIRDTNWLTMGSDWKLGTGANSDTDIWQQDDADHVYTIDINGDINPSVSNITDAGAKLYLKNNYYRHDNSGSATPYSRVITVVDHTDWVEVTATVGWLNRGRQYNYAVAAYLYDWR